MRPGLNGLSGPPLSWPGGGGEGSFPQAQPLPCCPPSLLREGASGTSRERRAFLLLLSWRAWKGCWPGFVSSLSGVAATAIFKRGQKCPEASLSLSLYLPPPLQNFKGQNRNPGAWVGGVSLCNSLVTGVRRRACNAPISSSLERE